MGRLPGFKRNPVVSPGFAFEWIWKTDEEREALRQQLVAISERLGVDFNDNDVHHIEEALSVTDGCWRRLRTASTVGETNKQAKKIAATARTLRELLFSPPPRPEEPRAKHLAYETARMVEAVATRAEAAKNRAEATRAGSGANPAENAERFRRWEAFQLVLGDLPLAANLAAHESKRWASKQTETSHFDYLRDHLIPVCKNHRWPLLYTDNRHASEDEPTSTSRMCNLMYAVGQLLPDEEARPKSTRQLINLMPSRKRQRVRRR